MAAYALLVRDAEPAARRLAHVLCGGGGDGDDAVQEAMVKAWYALPKYRGDAPFRPWLLRIVANQAHNRRRAAGRRAGYELRVREPAAMLSAEATVFDDGRRRDLVAAVAALPERLRDVVACRYLIELSETETAEVLGLPAGTVKSRLSRGLQRLRETVEE